jgi:hypothetical protein
VSPLWLIFEPTACAKRTVTTVPAGSTTGLTSGTAPDVLEADCVVLFAGCEEAEGPWDSLAGWGLLHPISITAKKHKTKT